MTIVTTHYRYKRPPKKKPPAAALEGPAVITIRDKKRVAKAERGVSDTRGSEAAPSDIDSARSQPAPAMPASDDPGRQGMRSDDTTALPPRKSAIVTIRRRGKRYAELEMTPEEHKRRGDAADELFRRLVREIEEKNRPAAPQKGWK